MATVALDPDLWESVEAGDTAVLEHWRASEGDRVHSGDVIATARLLGASIDICAPHDGILEEILLPEGERFAPGHPLAHVIDL